MELKNISHKSMDWIVLAQNGEQWQIDINTIMIGCVP
jgi:hypothetical protein